MKERNDWPPVFSPTYKLERILDRGDNPHQRAAVYLPESESASLWLPVPESAALSYQDYLDLETGWSMVNEFDQSIPACVIIRQRIPCGGAIAPTAGQALMEALACDPASSLGAMAVFNQPVDADLARGLLNKAVSAVVAPAYLEGADRLLVGRKEFRVIQCSRQDSVRSKGGWVVTQTASRVLLEDRDHELINPDTLRVVSNTGLTPDDKPDLVFGLKMVKHIVSNAAVVVADGRTLGIGSGQSTTERACCQALDQSCDEAKDAILVCDAPLAAPDAVHAALQSRIRAVVQPGGHANDAEVTAVCNKYKIAMVHTGVSHIRN